MAVRWWLAAPTALKRAHENSKKQLKIRKNCAVSSSLVEPITRSKSTKKVISRNFYYLCSAKMAGQKNLKCPSKKIREIKTNQFHEICF